MPSSSTKRNNEAGSIDDSPKDVRLLDTYASLRLPSSIKQQPSLQYENVKNHIDSDDYMYERVPARITRHDVIDSHAGDLRSDFRVSNCSSTSRRKHGINDDDDDGCLPLSKNRSWLSLPPDDGAYKSKKNVETSVTKGVAVSHTSRNNTYVAGVVTLGVYSDVFTGVGYQPYVSEEGFWVRYCILADFKYQKSWNQSKTVELHGTEDQMLSTKPRSLIADLRRLISKIAKDFWLDSKIQRVTTSIETNIRNRAPFDDGDDDDDEPFDLPKSLKVGKRQILSDVTPQLASSLLSRSSPSLRPETFFVDKNSSTQAKTENEFISLDFQSHCDFAGIHLRQCQVAIQPESFDRLESMRLEKIRQSAFILQSFAQLIKDRQCHFRKRAAIITIQSLVRMKLARRRVVDLLFQRYAELIQKCWRSFVVQKQMKVLRVSSATVIQQLYRSYKAAANKSGTVVQTSNSQGISSIITSNPASQLLLTKFNPIHLSPQISLVETLPTGTTASQPSGPSSGTSIVIDNNVLLNELYREIENENWAIVNVFLEKYPELAGGIDIKSGEVVLHKLVRHSGVRSELVTVVMTLNPSAIMHRDNMGALPIHHAAAFDNINELRVLCDSYVDGLKTCDKMGRLPLHVAAMYDALECVKFLLSRFPEGADIKVYRPSSNFGGGLPLHLACAHNASLDVVTSLICANPTSTKLPDENGDLPLHLLLRCGEETDPSVVKSLISCNPGVLSRTDSSGNLPLAIAIKSQCTYGVVNVVLVSYPEAARILNADHQNPLVLSFQNHADDRTIISLLNHAPELATAIDVRTGLLPIQIATENEQSSFIINHLLKRDLPIDLKEKVRARLVPHHFSWNHIVSNTEDMYHQVVAELLNSCTQPQVLALSHIEGPDGRTALASATAVCKYEIRVVLRLFNTLEVMHERPAYTNAEKDTQIFYALQFEPPPRVTGNYTVLHKTSKKGGDDDYIEEYDDNTCVSTMSRVSIRSTITSRTQQTVEDRLRHIRSEKGEHVIVKLTSRADIVEKELKVRKDYQLSRHYVPAVLSVHHTVQHAAYYDAMAESGFCITMEGADATVENQKQKLINSDRRVLAKVLKRIGVSLLHMHEHGLVHGDLGTHNIGLFGNRWKLLSVGGSIPIGGMTDPTRGIYPSPETVHLEHKRITLGKKSKSASIVSIPADPSLDIWAYGVLVFELVSGFALSIYANRGKSPLVQAEMHQLASWDESSIRKELGDMSVDDVAFDFLRKLLHPDPRLRLRSMRNVLDHEFLSGSQSPKSGERRTDNTPFVDKNRDNTTSHEVHEDSMHEEDPEIDVLTKSSTTLGNLKKWRTNLKKSQTSHVQKRIYI